MRYVTPNAILWAGGGLLAAALGSWLFDLRPWFLFTLDWQLWPIPLALGVVLSALGAYLRFNEIRAAFGHRKGIPTVIGVLVTFHIVCLGWILFRAENFDMAVAMLQGLGRREPVTALTPLLLTLVVGGLAMHWLPPRAIEGMAERLKTAPSITLGLLVGAAFLLIEAVRPDGVAPFIYFQF